MKRQELGDRRHNRIVLRRPAFIFTEPGAPWIECVVVDVSESGLCINVGALVVPEMFGVAFTSNGSIRRVCARAWRNGELIGARFLSAKDLRGTVGSIQPAALICIGLFLAQERVVSGD